MQIKPSIPSEHAALTDIAFSAKRHWNYPEKYYDIWKDELTVTEQYIQKHIVYSAWEGGGIVGFYSIVENKADLWVGEVFVQKGWWLEHIFILPTFHKQGIGTELINHAIQMCETLGIESLLIFSDPYAKGFYEKIGAKFLNMSKSSIEGRELPVYELSVYFI